MQYIPQKWWKALEAYTLVGQAGEEGEGLVERGVALGGIEAIPATKTRHGLAKSFPAFLFDG